jgi:Tfp pilus assembly PilM family ATPase
MSTLNDIIARVRGLGLERLVPLRPPYPPVVLQVECDGMLLVRLKRRRRGSPLLESFQSRPLESVPTSIFQAGSIAADELAARVRELFEVSGTRPGRVSLLLPDNLAKVSLLALPERPASRRQLDELVRAKMRRAVPFRLDDASVSYQLLSGEKRGVSVLVVVVRQNLVERIERAVDEIGARVGLIDISTPNLLNLCRDRIDAASRSGGDAALLNCAPNYFSLVIVRDQRLIFFRCKTYALGEEASSGPNGMFLREIASSFSYYREKLDGQGVQTLFVRNAGAALDGFGERLREFGCAEVELLDPASRIELAEGVRIDSGEAQRIASAIGAAIARGN